MAAPLQQFSDKAQEEFRKAHQQWIDAGETSDGPIDTTADTFVRRYKTAVKGEVDGSGNYTKMPTHMPIPGIDLDARPKLKETMGQKIGGAAQAVTNYIAAVPVGVAEGVSEVVNPQNFLHNTETLARGAGITAAKLYQGEGFHPLDALSEAKQQAIIPHQPLSNVAAGTRASLRSAKDLALGKYATGGTLFDRIKRFSNDSDQNYQEELGRQEIFDSTPGTPEGRLAGNVAVAVTDAAPILSAIGGKATKVIENLRSIRKQYNILNDGFSPKQFAESSKAVGRMLSDVGSDLKTALFTRAGQVKELMRSGKTGLMDTVRSVRDQLETNRRVLGEAVGTLRTAVTTGAPEAYDTSLILKSLDSFIAQKRYSGGGAAMSDRDVATINRFRNKLVNNNKPFTTKDASQLISEIDDHLEAVGWYNEQNRTMANNQLFGVRQAVDSEIAARYPAYKEVKLRFSDFSKQYDQFKNRIQGSGAESFFANMFGRNKTEQQETMVSLMDAGQETADAFRAAVKDAKNISSTNQKYNDAVVELVTKADEIKTRSGKDLMNELSNKAVARRLQALSDPDKDEIRDIVNSYADSRSTTAAGTVGVATMPIATYIFTRLTGGNSTAGAIAGTATSGLAAAIAKGVTRPFYLSKARKMYDVEKLFTTIAKEADRTPLAAKLAADSLSILKKLGPDAADAFLNSINIGGKLKTELDSAIDAATLMGTSAGGAAAAVGKKENK